MNHTLVFVHRNSLGDCTCNGLSSKVTQGQLFWNCTREDAINYCEENMINPKYQFFLVNRTLWGEDHSYVEPLIKPNHKNQMFGGNFVYTSSDNFYKLGGLKTGLPIPVHDRFEEWEY